jgi:hypothetical protein
MEGTDQIKNKKVRSASYPATNLEKAIQNVQTIKSNLGKGPFSRDSAAKALGYSGISGKSATVVAALVHYGLLNRKVDTYTVSELSDEILTYRDDAERQAAIVKAAKHPKLYNALVKAYDGRSLPGMLDHILVREHGIGEKVAPNVTKDFRSSMSFAGLLVNGVVNSAPQEGGSPNPSDTSTVGQSEETPAGQPPRNDPGIRTPDLSQGMQHVEIADGVILSYRGDLAFQLITTPEFATALQSLKKAVKQVSAAPEDGDGGNQEQTSELA